jgi:periplasmic glucans biosynthesis protein
MIRIDRFPSRRAMLVGGLVTVTLAAGTAAWAVPTAADGTSFDISWLKAQAQALAAKPYEAPPNVLPDALKDLPGDRYREIRFRADQSLWRDQGLTFEAQFLHLGSQYQDAVRIYEVANGVAREVLYGPSEFDFGKSGIDPAQLKDLGFSGVRLHYPLNRSDYYDEIAVFQGATFFRSIGRGQVFGLSARGIAINTALPEGEEYPSFRALWLERPRPGAAELRMHALLDGPSAAGAYSFAIHPGEITAIDVTATLVPRNPIKLVGVAPLTSMYFFGENDRLGVDDYRPEVHDSDGLAIWHGNGEWLWRPLVNPAQLAVTSFADQSPRGFGLLQRDRDFRDYEDLDARPDLRPTVWVEPLADWGRGEVRLIEIPSDQEIHDNIVAFWAPEQPVQPGQPMDLAYRLHWGPAPPLRPPGATVCATRVGRSKDDNVRRFAIDFSGGALQRLAPDAPLEAVVSVSNGQIRDVRSQANPMVGGWRAMFDFAPDGNNADLRCFLRQQNTVLSETWSYRWMT